MYKASGPSRWMIRLAVPNGPRGATTVLLLLLLAIVEDAVAVVVATTGVVDSGTIRCCHPTSCNAFGIGGRDIVVVVVVVPEDVAMCSKVGGFTSTVVLGTAALETLVFVEVAPPPPPPPAPLVLPATSFQLLLLMLLLVLLLAPTTFPATSLILLMLLLPKARPFNVFCLRNCIRVLMVSSG